MSDNVNYVIRPNKNIERKLIAECLSALRPSFDIPTYRYVGMGSFWFIDFVMFHRALGIQEMLSIEHDEHAPRAEFNRPLSCIKIVPGNSKDVLPKLKIEEKKTIFWLDYTKGLQGSVLPDLSEICGRALAGTIVIVTVNASSGQLKNGRDPDDNQLSELETLKYLVGDDLVPAGVRKVDLSLKLFPELLGDILINKLKHSVREYQSSKRFEVLFNFSYQDDAPMVTVGGMITDDAGRTKLSDCKLERKLDFIGESQYAINVLPFTSKEKITVDRLLPGGGVLDKELARTALEWQISDIELSAYEKFYRHYPIFGEYQI